MNIMPAGSTPKCAAYQSASLTPDHAPNYHYADDADDTTKTVVTPHSNGPRPRLPRPVLPGGAFSSKRALD
jgi:hypothetical protein